MDELSPKQRQFVNEYTKDFNGTQAAIRAGYEPNNAGCQASRMLTNDNIAKSIGEAMRKNAERAGIDSVNFLHRLIAEVDADIGDLFTDCGCLKPVHEWPEVWRSGLVTGIEVIERFEYLDDDGRVCSNATQNKRLIARSTKLKMADRAKRLEMIGKHTDVAAFTK